MPLADRREATDGAAAVVRRAEAPADVANLRSTAERLLTAAHPGVVRVLSSQGDAARWELRVAHGGRPLPATSPSPVGLAAIVAGVASTLADLHAIGIVHGRLRADHVLIGQSGRPVLCGFGPRPDDAPGTPRPTPADDVAALGAAIRELLAADADAEASPQPRRSRRRGWDQPHTGLLELADQACADPPTRRPTARRLAAAAALLAPPDDVHAATASVASPRSVGPASTSEGPAHLLARRGRWASMGAIAVIVVLLALASGAVRSRADRAAQVGTPVAAATPPTTLDAPQTTTHTSERLPEIDGTTPIVDANLVLLGDDRFEVGEPGDQIVIGDFDCDGEATPALLRPGTSEVFVFPRWADEEPVRVRPVTSVADATALVAEEMGGGCHRLLVERQPGDPVTVLGSADEGAPER